MCGSSLATLAMAVSYSSVHPAVSLGERHIVVCHQRPEFIDALQVVLLEMVEGRAIGIPCRIPVGRGNVSGLVTGSRGRNSALEAGR